MVYELHVRDLVGIPQNFWIGMLISKRLCSSFNRVPVLYTLYMYLVWKVSVALCCGWVCLEIRTAGKRRDGDDIAFVCETLGRVMQ